MASRRDPSIVERGIVLNHAATARNPGMLLLWSKRKKKTGNLDSNHNMIQMITTSFKSKAFKSLPVLMCFVQSRSKKKSEKTGLV
jgi:hypothetical protein